MKISFPQKTKIQNKPMAVAFLILLIINIALIKTDFAWTLTKINPFIIGFIIYTAFGIMVSGLTRGLFNTRSITKILIAILVLAILFYTYSHDPNVTPILKHFENWYLLLGLLVGLIENLITWYIKRNKIS
jgi:hypothetical protein